MQQEIQKGIYFQRHSLKLVSYCQGIRFLRFRWTFTFIKYFKFIFVISNVDYVCAYISFLELSSSFASLVS